MTSKIVIIIALCFSNLLFAQDSVRVETVVDTSFKTPQYVAVYDDVFLTHQETKWLLKYDPMAWVTQIASGIGEQRVEFEYKLCAAVSLNMASYFNVSYNQSIYAQGRNIYSSKGFGLSIEPRWYYQMTKKIANKQSANNLSGNYFGLKIGAEVIPKGLGIILLGYDKDTIYNNIIRKEATNESKAITSYECQVNYGIQKRLFQRSYVNFSFGLGIKREQSVRIYDVGGKAISYKSFWRPFLDNRVSFGFVFGGKKQSKTHIASCDLFRCFEEDNNLLKINLLGLVQNLDIRNIAARTAISYEFWLLNTKNISLNSTIAVSGKYYSRPSLELNAWEKDAIKSMEFKVTIEPRYYNGLKRHIAQGKSAHSFSGGYFGLPISLIIQNNNQQSHFFDGVSRIKPMEKSKTLTLACIYGIQKRLFKNGYFDLSAGPGFRGSQSQKYKDFGSGLNFAFRGELGFAF